jgi:nucleotide-binding universal stress UspA family protein
MVKKILVPTDGSEHARKAVAQACEMALKYKARVYLVHVVSPIPDGIGEPGLLGKLEDNQRRFAEEVLREASREVRKRGVGNLQASVLYGDPAQGIIAFAKENGVDMIVMGSRGAGSIETLMLGSVSSKVCHMADCTCVTVK